MRWTSILLFAVSVAGCGRDSVSERVDNLGCGTAGILEGLAPGVAFTNNTEARITTWRNAVGPPVVDRANRSCADAGIDSLLVVSWNEHIGHGDIRRFVSDLRAGRVLPGLHVQHFVILMQEVFREGDAVPAHAPARICPKRVGGVGPDIEDISDSLGLALYYVPSMRNGCEATGRREDRGNAILSTLPLTNLRAVELPLVRQRRVAVMADVKGHTSTGENWTLSLASTHFENRGPGRPRDWIHGRARQAEALVKALPESKLAVVGGDFNTLTGTDEPAVRIVGARFKNSPKHQKNITYVSYAVVRSHLDYLFFPSPPGQHASYWRARSRYGSDHYPIMGFVRVK